jgi:hypothetical protein
MRSESGKTVDEPAAMMSPVTASGAYIAIESSGAASAGGAAVGSGGAEVGSTTGGASVVDASPHAVRIKLIATSTNMNVRTKLVISAFSPWIFIRCHLIKWGLRLKEEQVNILLKVLSHSEEKN